MDKIDIKLTGQIVPITPINISRPDAPKDEKGVPRLTVVTHGATIKLPYIPGETLKGLLRTTSAGIAAKASGQKLDLQLYFQLYKGGIKGDEKENAQNLRKIVAFRESHPVLGLYGAASPLWLGSSISVRHAVPATESDAAIQSEVSMRIDDFKRDPQRLVDISPDAVDDYIDYVDGVKAKGRLKTEISDIDKKLKKLFKDKAQQPEIDDLKAQKKALEDRVKVITDDVGNTIGRPLDRRYAIAMGSRLEHQIRVSAGTPAEVGLLLETLCALSRKCRIGGLESTGHGYFGMEYAIQVRPSDGDAYEDAGTISIQPDVHDLSSEHPLVLAALQAWRDRCAAPETLQLKSA